MISKVFELKNNLDKNIYLFHGQNDGHKETILNDHFKNDLKKIYIHILKKRFYLILINFIILFIQNHSLIMKN